MVVYLIRIFHELFIYFQMCMSLTTPISAFHHQHSTMMITTKTAQMVGTPKLKKQPPSGSPMKRNNMDVDSVTKVSIPQ